ncbi:hypothetical protein Scep_026494 [Stephania cephalantha]|uniref:Ankyrin repeat-containing protein BDA1-like n=1 Tax=Stephania cephalantha TaxID=152367 RepID=A0AAP0HTD3_9MAGN
MVEMFKNPLIGLLLVVISSTSHPATTDDARAPAIADDTLMQGGYLFQAALTGDIEAHITVLAGKPEFAKEILRLKPGFASELNIDGFNPIHMATANGQVELVIKELLKDFFEEISREIDNSSSETRNALMVLVVLIATVTFQAGAAANGYLEIVRELLKIDCNLCRLKGRERRTPLHFAVVKGRVEIINELLSSCPESVEDVTIGGETVLHLAVMNYQFEAFEIMFEKLKQLNRETLLNSKDEQGNMVLHLAAYMKQREANNKGTFNFQPVIELLLCNDFLSRAVEVNAMNSSNFTALDFLQGLPREISSGQIETMLLRAGAIRSEAISNEHGNAASPVRSLQPLG